MERFSSAPYEESVVFDSVNEVLFYAGQSPELKFSMQHPSMHQPGVFFTFELLGPHPREQFLFHFGPCLAGGEDEFQPLEEMYGEYRYYAILTTWNGDPGTFDEKGEEVYVLAERMDHGLHYYAMVSEVDYGLCRFRSLNPQEAVKAFFAYNLITQMIESEIPMLDMIKMPPETEELT